MRLGIKELSHRQGWLYGAVIGILVGIVIGHYLGDSIF